MGKAVEVLNDITSGIGKAVENVGDAIGKAVGNIINNPLPVIETLALTAVGVPPMVSSAIVAGMNGGSPEDIVKAAVVSSVSAGVAPNVSTALVDAGVNQGVAQTIGSAVAGGVRSELSGGDFTQGALTSGVNTGFNQATDFLATTANTPIMNTDNLNVSSGLPDVPPADVPAPLSTNYDVPATDYSLTGDKSNIPTSDQGLNPAGAYTSLTTDSITGQAPGLATMGGGSGTAIDASTPLGSPTSFINNPDISGALGTVSGAGFTDQGATPSIGSPGSFINNPNVTGQPVIGTPSCAYKVDVPNIKISSLLGGTSSKVAPSTGGGYTVTGNALSPWLDSSAEMLVNKLNPADLKTTKLADDTEADKRKKIESLYGQMDACLAKEFQDRYGGVPQISTLGSSLGEGNFAQPSGYSSALGYASGGTTTCYCLNNNPNYMPKFADCGPSLLQTVASQKRASITPKQLQYMQQHIAPMGNMGGLAHGGLPKKYQDAAPDGHNPEFVTGLTGFYACGGGTGQSDDIPAMLHDGDYVMDAEAVSALGDGSSKAGKQVLEGFRSQIPHRESGGGKPVPAKIADGEYVFPAGFVTALGGGDNKAGAKILDGLREKLRAHKRSAPTSKIPPKAKSPLDYIEGAKG